MHFFVLFSLELDVIFIIKFIAIIMLLCSLRTHVYLFYIKIFIFAGMVWMLKDTSTSLYSMTLNGGTATVWDLDFTTLISRTTWSAFPNSQLCGTRISSLIATTPKLRKMYLVHRIYIYIYASSLLHSYRVYMLWDKWCIYSVSEIIIESLDIGWLHPNFLALSCLWMQQAWIYHKFYYISWCVSYQSQNIYIYIYIYCVVEVY